MVTCLVTGAAGFIGSHLCERLIMDGHRVVGLDAFIPYYPRELKENNLRHLHTSENFELHDCDLRTANLDSIVKDVDVIFHLAAMAGLRRSWSEFSNYMTCNVLATQRLLEAATSSNVYHFLHASTSSVYGRHATGDETAPLAPISPYGITKLAAEHLCQAYARNFQLPTTILRLFSVYGPRQRPDMGYNIFIRAILDNQLIIIDGDGTDSRSNTYVQDCVQGLTLAFEQPEKSVGEIFNLGGGEEVSVNEVLAMLQELTGKPVRITHGPPRKGDQKRTVANISKARQVLSYRPSTSVINGLKSQLDWQKENLLPKPTKINMLRPAHKST